MWTKGSTIFSYKQFFSIKRSLNVCHVLDSPVNLKRSLDYLFYKWLHLGYIMIVFFLVMRPVFCVAPEVLYYWYSRNPRMLDVLTMKPFLPQGFHWIISASWRGGICRLGNSSSSIDTYPDLTNWRKAVERTLQLRRSASEQHGKQTYTCCKYSPQLVNFNFIHSLSIYNYTIASTHV